MFKTTAPGFILLVSSLGLYVFKLVCRLMDRQIPLFSIEDIVGIQWIDSVPVDALRQVMLAVSTQQLSVIFLILGLSLVFFGVFQKN